MTVGIAARKAVELENKLASLDEEMRHWEQEAAAGGPLEKHHTQVTAVTWELSVPLDNLRAGLDGLDALGGAAEIEQRILHVHRLWDIFRSKLALRYVKHFAHYLVGADELAYRCYHPAEQRGAAREPPLVFFGDDLSPVTRMRGAELAPQDRAEPLLEPLRRLPVPLIGLPWFQVEHLPDAPIIAHEVGHDVESDLALGAAADAAVEAALARAGVDEPRRRAWMTWREEAFADTFGTLALGPAFTSTLGDFLAAEPRTIAGQWQSDPDWRPHPPSTLRVLLSTEVLALIADGAYADRAARLRAEWLETYPRHAMAAFEPDLPIVAAALVAGPYPALGGGPLGDLVAFAPEAHERAERDARELARGLAPRCEEARELVAAARLAFDADPDGFRAARVSQRILRRIRDAQSVGTRTGTASPIAADVREARYRAAGEWLNDYLEERHVQAHDD